MTAPSARRLGGRPFINLVGRRFGRWLVLAIHPKRGRSGHVLWRTRCECNTESVVDGSALRRGSSTSCGCFQREQAAKRPHAIKHGHARRGKTTSAYRRWQNMFQRCFNPNNPGYLTYGARGIRPCEAWHSFLNHYADVGDAPPGKSIDRVNVDGNYEPDNVRWASAREQALNRRNSKQKRRRADLADIQAFAQSMKRAASAQVDGDAP
jgi:hypothetical protein